MLKWFAGIRIYTGPTLFCRWFGHEPDGPVHFVHTDSSGGGYNMRECRRCVYRVPVNADDAAKKSHSTAKISEVMNGSRAGFGLKPISWDL